MSTAIATEQSSKRTWYIYHVIAALSLSLLIMMLAALLSLIGPDPQAAARNFFSSPVTTEVFPRVAPILAMCLLSAFWLWVAMLRHFISNRTVASPAWWFWLIASNWGAAIVYFFIVWRPRNKHVRT